MENTDTIHNQYLCNPDVVLREEDESGALLFNPDTNQVKVLNATGLFIWKQFQSENSPDAVLKAITEAFEDVPEAQVTDDVAAFLNELLQTGFIGEVMSA
jgi:hypothetical protein